MASLVRGIALSGFDEFAISQGLEPQPLLAEIGLPNDAVDSLISGAQFVALLELCATRSHNPLFGLQLGLHQGPKALGSLLYVVKSTSTLGQVLEAVTQYFHFHSTGADLHLERQGGAARLLYDVTDGDVIAVRQTVELAMGICARLIQDLLGHPWKPLGLQLRHPVGEKPSAYRHLLGVTPHFGSPVNAWVFDESLLESPLSAIDEGFHELAKGHIAELAQFTLQELPSYVKKLLRRQLPNTQATVDQVAEQMKISPRSLQRYLQSENTSFQKLLDETRQSMATRYMCDSSVSLTQLSELLGYSDLSAFSRAFTRWNGMSPQKWKQHHRQMQQIAIHRSSVTAPAFETEQPALLDKSSGK
ncbi:AraC-like transcriptional regulator QhpR [Pseudomonas citronellolis]|uniref:AraC-like transcriptional regulator QhpR n=1 Tax=Pseudomonas citronellolis TaxID=53408 RepID=UPI000E2F23F7|nr:AraC family transcriptional regulator [Pseudomonas citronellolis]MCP1603590.1 AraC-like DNA-binding protein [Pseudomonas citronellolis]MCP1653343.1 AraC-like DNA-binding protein [Pseudomonas citronellolis]MCP1720337.1 AraC-like DNA-binding protein [Pseudomonas citronellolis]